MGYGIGEQSNDVDLYGKSQARDPPSRERERMREREEEKMVTRYLIWIGLIAALVSGCAVGKTNWGASFESAKANQILNPEAGKNLNPVSGFDGQAAKITIEKYREDFTRPTPKTVYSISIGGIGQR